MHKHIDGCANASARASCSQQDALELLQDWDCSLPHVLDKKQVLLVWIMPFLIPRSAVTSEQFLYPSSSFGFPWSQYPCAHLIASFFLTLSPFLLCGLVLSPFSLGKDTIPSHQPSHVLMTPQQAVVF